MYKVGSLMLVGLALGGCGTITRGSTEQVTFTSDPPGAQVQTSIGHTCPATPCTYDVSRKSEFVASFSKDGYEPQQIPVTTRVSGNGGASFAGNVLVGGVIGMAADASTGAALDHTPNPVHAQLLPLSSARPGSAKARRKRPVPRAATEEPAT